MDFYFLLRGLVIGFSIAAPVGAIGILCIRRTLAEGRAHGLASGLGAATADLIYGCIAGFGLTFISEILVSQQSLLRLFGGVSLCILGLRTLLSRPAKQAVLGKGTGILNAYVSTFLLTLTNPMTILSFVAIFAGLGVGATDTGYTSATMLISGVFAGSTLWWLVLTAIVGMFRSRVTPSALQWINIISGMIITAFGAVALLSLIL